MSIPILMYHSLDDSGSVVSVSPDTFKWQMHWLSNAGYKTLSFTRACELIKQNRDVPDKSICITFDDGYQSVFTSAFPVLKQYGFTATVFLISGYIGKNNQWPGQANVPLMPLSPWEEILEMHAAGIEMGAHTVSHPFLDRLSASDALVEIDESRRVIAGKLGGEVVSFAYPYGAYNEETKSLVTNLFSYACTTYLDFANTRCPAIEIPRLDAFYLSNKKVFRLMGTPAFARYVCFRRLLRRLRRLLGEKKK